MFDRPAARSASCAAVAMVLWTAAALCASPAEAVKRRAFVTSVAGSGILASWPGATGPTVLDMADSICRARAAAASPTPLPNASTYRAWLSTSTVDAYCHVQGLAGKRSNGCNGAVLPGAGPWYLANGITNFTAGLDALVGSGEIYRPVQLDENRQDIPTALDQRLFWSGTKIDGTADPSTCTDWTVAAPGVGARAGEAYATSSRWTLSIIQSCNTPHRLLCLEPGASETAVLGWSPGALVFITSETGPGDLGEWPEAEGLQGIAAGYRICQHLAAAQHLPSPASFVPWLSTLAVDAADRVTSDGPFRRLDNYTVAGDFADLVDGTVDTSIHVTDTGDYLLESGGVWTGTNADGAAVAERCGDWTASSSLEDGLTGLATYSRLPDWTTNFIDSCIAPNRLYCISNQITVFWDGFEMTGDTGRWSSTVP